MKQLLIALICVLVISGCAPIQNDQTISSTNTPFPTYPLAKASTAIPLATADLDILYEEDFLYATNGWWVGETQYVKAFYQKGEYHILGINSELMNWSVLEENSFTNGVMTVDFQVVSEVENNTGGTFFWRVVDNDNFYFLQQFSEGYFSVGKYIKGELIPIIEMTKSLSYLPGNVVNKVTIVFNDHDFEIYINDNIETTFTDDSLNSGFIGLGVFTSEKAGLEVAFDNLAVFKFDRSNSYTPEKPIITPTLVTRAITWNELADFLVRDHTNWNTYDINTYNCLDFAVDLVANAKNENIKAWVVGVDFTNGDTGHAFVAFETSDQGTIL